MSTGGPYSKKRKTGDGPDEERIPGVYNPDNAAVAQQIQDTLGNAPREPSQRMPIGGKSSYTDPAAGGAPDMSDIPDAPPAQQPSAPAGAQSGENYDQLLDRSPDPTQPDQRGDRRRGGVGFGVDEIGSDWRLTNQDYNPNGYQPNESRSTGVGKYQSSPLFEATIGAPHSVIGSKLATNDRKREELNKALQSFDPYAGIEDVNAPEYRDAFQRNVMQSVEDYMQAVYDLYGEEEGNRRMMTPGTEEWSGLRKLGVDWTTISRNLNQATKSAEAIVVGRNEGTLEVSDDLYNQAYQQRYKTGEWAGRQDPDKMAKDMVTFNANVSLVDQLQKDKVFDVLKNAGSVQKLYERTKKGDLQHDPRFSTLVGRKTVDNEAIVDALTDHYSKQYKGTLTRDKVRELIKSGAPQLEEQNIVRAQYHKPSSKGSGGGGGNTGRGTNVRGDYRPLNVGMTHNADGTPSNTIYLTPYQNTGDKEHTVKEMVATADDGPPNLPMRDVTLTYHPGRNEWLLAGQSLTEQGKSELAKITGGDDGEVLVTADMLTGEGGVDSPAVEKKKDLIWSQYRKQVLVPADRNSSLVDTYWGNPDAATAAANIVGIDPSEMASLMRTQEGRDQVARRLGINVPQKKQAAPKAGAAPDFVIQKGYTQADWDGLTDEQRRKILAKGKL